MRFSLYSAGPLLATVFLLFTVPSLGQGEKKEWIDLFGDKVLELWKGSGGWQVAGDVEIDPNNPRKLLAKPGKGVLVNIPKGKKAPNLVSEQKFSDIEVHVEFYIPKGSNSGVKLEGFYEIQIFDSWGVKKPKATDCGGIYPRAEQKPKYHHIDEGIPPKSNACKAPGEWQTLDIIFQPPRFDEEGKKIANARFVKVVLNGTLIHENVEVKTPTGALWKEKEIPQGPLLLQGDHGPVAFRNVRVRPYVQKE
jgi:hypothetical protein